MYSIYFKLAQTKTKAAAGWEKDSTVLFILHDLFGLDAWNIIIFLQLDKTLIFIVLVTNTMSGIPQRTVSATAGGSSSSSASANATTNPDRTQSAGGRSAVSGRGHGHGGVSANSTSMSRFYEVDKKAVNASRWKKEKKEDMPGPGAHDPIKALNFEGKRKNFTTTRF